MQDLRSLAGFISHWLRLCLFCSCIGVWNNTYSSVSAHSAIVYIFFSALNFFAKLSMPSKLILNIHKAHKTRFVLRLYFTIWFTIRTDNQWRCLINLKRNEKNSLPQFVRKRIYFFRVFFFLIFISLFASQQHSWFMIMT